MISIALVAGEVSGDVLGAGLIKAIKDKIKDVEFTGIAGPRMKALGCKSLFPFERMSIIGLDGITHLPNLFMIRRRLCDHYMANPPSVYIGIDIPDFNLPVEKKLKEKGIPTIHYVGPTVWAWRGYRIKRIHKAVDHMLTLFPFEEEYYRKQNISVSFVGHPLADDIGDISDKLQYRTALGLPENVTVITVMPGSRHQEIKRHTAFFIETIQTLAINNKDIYFVVPFTDQWSLDYFSRILNKRRISQQYIKMFLHRSHEALGACDLAFIASGTATLEATLFTRPMVVAYRLSSLSYYLIRFFAHVDKYTLPNNLAKRCIIPEYIQDDAVPERIADAIQLYLDNKEFMADTKTDLADIKKSFKPNANENAAAAILQFLAERYSSERN